VVCLDTSIIIDYLNGEKKIIELVDSYRLKEKISTTTITEFELLKHKDKIKRSLAEEILDSLQVYSFNRPSALEASKIFEKLRDLGKMINENDILIAAIAIANNELLITRDEKFNYINDERIFVISNNIK
jgi:predicted nucleic acid-binding protein